MTEDGAAPLDRPPREIATTGAAPSWVRAAPVLLLALVCAAYLLRRHQVDLRFPVPWPDEGSFLWQALAFRDRLSLFAPEVNPQREALWMPPGSMVLEGLIFMVVPFSLSAARALSALFVCGAVAAVFAAIRRQETRALFAVVAPLFLFCPIARMAGNVARMEGLELFLLSLAFLLLERRRAAALGVLLLAPIVHPNGVFGVAVGFGYFLWRRRRESFVLRRGDVAVLAASVLAWAVYAFHVTQHWADFVRDMGAQLRFKHFVSAADGGQLGRLKEPVVWGSALVLVLAAVRARRAGEGVGALAALLATLLLQTSIAAGWLYDIYPAFAVLLATVVAADAGFATCETVFPAERRAAAAVGLAVLLVAIDAAAYRHNAFLERSLENATVLRNTLSPAYVTAADRAAVERYLASITPPPGAPRLSVQFVPDAEALLYEKLRGPTLGYVQQTFYEHHYDVLVLHDSVWFPPYVRNLELLKLIYARGEKVEQQIIYQRNGTEKWTSYRWAR
jgi:hypothetical protein